VIVGAVMLFAGARFGRAADVVTIGGARYLVLNDGEVATLADAITKLQEENTALKAKLEKGGCS
jgi:hypothetical protein